MNARIVLSPNQILGSSLWGGPIAAVYYLRRNYLALGKEELAQKALILGVIFIALLLGLIPFLPEKFPNMALPLIYCLSAKQIATTTQLEKINIEQNDAYTFESNWKILGVGFLTLISFLVISILVIFMLDAIGFLSLA